MADDPGKSGGVVAGDGWVMFGIDLALVSDFLESADSNNQVDFSSAWLNFQVSYFS
jgi:hypothetical protein